MFRPPARMLFGALFLVGTLTMWGTTANAGVRRDITTLSPKELTAYRDAFRQLQESGAYAKLAGHHGCPEYYCHRDDRIFLPWHRAYVLRFEQALQKIDSSLALHYWDWTSAEAIKNGIPAVFTDSEYVSGGGKKLPNPLRTFHFSCDGTDKNTERFPDGPFLLEGLKEAVDDSYLLTTYDEFNSTDGIQGPHNSLHVWVGGEMGDTTFAAFDPIFWAHHSNVDRQWARWQDCDAGPGPSTTIKNLDLEPFDLKAADVIDYHALGYKYDNLGCTLLASVVIENPRAIRIPGVKVRPGVEQALFVEGLADHPEASARVYVFIDQPDATLADVRPDNPRFAGFFGVFGGKHDHDGPGAAAQPAGEGHHGHEAGRQRGVQVLDLTPALTRVARAADGAEEIDLNLTIIATGVTEEAGTQTELRELPFDRVSVGPKRQ